MTRRRGRDDQLGMRALKVHFEEEMILMSGLKVQIGIHETQRNMCKGNKVLEKIKWHGEEKHVFGYRNHRKA